MILLKLMVVVDDILDKLKHLSQNLPEAEQFNLGVSELETVINGVQKFRSS